VEEETAGTVAVVGAAGCQAGILLLPSVGVRAPIAVVGRIAGRTSRQKFVAGETGGVGVPNLFTSDTLHRTIVGTHIVSNVHELATVAVSVTEGGHDELVGVNGAAHGHGDKVLVVIVVVAGQFTLKVKLTDFLKGPAVLQVEFVGIHLGAVGIAITGIVVIANAVLADGVEKLIGTQVGDEGVDVGRFGTVVETELSLHDTVEGVGDVGSEGEGSAHVPFLVSITALTIVIIFVDAVLAPSVRTTNQFKKKREKESSIL
jgi:hypothetical protein